jgi:hypothetical protein
MGGSGAAKAPALVVQQRKSSAIRIVNPDTKAEVKGDAEKLRKERDAKEAADAKRAADETSAASGSGGGDSPGGKSPGDAGMKPPMPGTPATPLAAAAAAAARLNNNSMPGGGMGGGGPGMPHYSPYNVHPPNFSPYGSSSGYPIMGGGGGGPGMPPRQMMGSPGGGAPMLGSSPGSDAGAMFGNFSVGSPERDAANHAAAAAHAHAHAHAHAQVSKSLHHEPLASNCTVYNIHLPCPISQIPYTIPYTVCPYPIYLIPHTLYPQPYTLYPEPYAPNPFTINPTP